MGVLSRLIAIDPVVSYPFAGLALLRATLRLWLRYERTRTAIAYLRRARAQTGERRAVRSCRYALG